MGVGTHLGWLKELKHLELQLVGKIQSQRLRNTKEECFFLQLFAVRIFRK